MTFLKSSLKTTAYFTSSILTDHLLVYNQPLNYDFSNKLETVQYNAALEIMGSIKGVSLERLYQQLTLESLRQRRWMKHIWQLFQRFFK